MQKMIAAIRTRYHHFSARAGSLYQRALQYTGIQDCTEARFTAAVAVIVALYYICAAIQFAINLLTDAAPMLTALLTK